MFFQTNDDCLGVEDASLVYVRDRHGILTSPPGYEKSPTRDVLRECDTVYGASCARQVGENLQTPYDLFKICVNFVAKNIHLLESLRDFPEYIGHSLFWEACRVKTIYKSSDYLKIFCEAYKELVLKDLDLLNERTFIDARIKYLQCFNNLTELNLSHCKLGNKHEYLTFIGKMKSLEFLYLKDNCLTDSGISSWTLPHRMLNTGPEFLKILDLSCNPDLTGFCLKALIKFTHLKSLNLSGTAVTITPGIEKFKKLMNFSLVSYIKEFSSSHFTITKGWASSFITELSEKVKEERAKKWPRSTGAGNFYRRRVLPSTSTDVPSEINFNIYPVVLLQSVDDVLPGTIRTLTESKDCQGRKITNDESNTQKIAHVKDGNSDEINDAKLLDSYLKYL